MNIEFVTTIGQDSHRFVEADPQVEMDSSEENNFQKKMDSFAAVDSPLISSRAEQQSVANASQCNNSMGCTSDSTKLSGENRILKLGGVSIPDCPALAGNSDADVILHALTNAISGLSGVNILGDLADKLCRQGVKDSTIYLKEALRTLPAGVSILHVSITLEGSRPKLKPYIAEIKKSIGSILGITSERVGLTATTGEGLTAFGRGEGIQVFCLISFRVERASR